jgi:hypothetical protein
MSNQSLLAIGLANSQEERSSMNRKEFVKITQRITRNLLTAAQTLEILELENPDMPVSPDVAAVIAEFDTATNAIADRIQRLINRPNSPLSAEDKAAFSAEVVKLQALGKDPEEPIPSNT